ncbi:BPTI/Kunitz-type proteinase inhibitor domain-containing protein [Halochromatium salexigens]
MNVPSLVQSRRAFCRLGRLPLVLLALAALGLVLVGCAGTGGDTDDLIHVSCLQVPQPGRCSKPRAAFYYDYQTDSCKAFARGVCDPSWPFRSMRDCVKACGGKPVP